ncbi:MAG: hypothetical protein RLY19_845 [Actinomycetota bacterium]|jgi:hypothetical protein
MKQVRLLEEPLRIQSAILAERQRSTPSAKLAFDVFEHRLDLGKSAGPHALVSTGDCVDTKSKSE